MRSQNVNSRKIIVISRKCVNNNRGVLEDSLKLWNRLEPRVQNLEAIDLGSL